MRRWLVCGLLLSCAGGFVETVLLASPLTDDERLRRGADHLLKNTIDYRRKPHDVYYWYYATQVLHHMGGDEWHQWNSVIREVLPKAQEREGKDRGSWTPVGDEYGPPGGRMFSTCFCVFILESYYRHLPLYRQGS